MSQHSTISRGWSLICRIKNKGSNDFALYGQEVNGSTWALAKMNMFLHGMDSARIEWGNTLKDPKLLENDTATRFMKGRVAYISMNW